MGYSIRLTEKGEKARVYLIHYFLARHDAHEPAPEQTKDKFAHVARCEIAEMPNQRLPRLSGESRKQALMRLEVAAKEKLLKERLNQKWLILEMYFTPNKFGKTPSLRRLASRFYYHHTHIGAIIRSALNEAGEILFPAK